MATKLIVLSKKVGVDDAWVLHAEDKDIETYEQSKTINFERFIKYLIDDDFNSEFELDSKLVETTAYEDNLLQIIKEIIASYNKEKIAYEAFLRSEKVEMGDLPQPASE